MAFNFNKDYDIIATRQGIKLISDYLIRYKEEVTIELRHVGTNDEVILIQTKIKDLIAYSNTVSLYPYRKEIMINPIFFNKENATIQLKEFVQSIPQLVRDIKLESIVE